MGEHFTRNTVSVAAYCKKCGRQTQHRVDDRIKGPCMECMSKLEKAHVTGDLRAKRASQGNLFHA